MKARLLTIAALIPIASPACTGTDGEGTSEHAERFVRSWLVTGAEGWALIPTATVYGFESDGTISVERQIDGSYFEGPAGAWTLADQTTNCSFGNYWRSVGDSTVIVDAECSDGVQREAWLQFSEDATQNSQGPGPELIEPADATPRWDSPQGQFRLCRAVEGNEFQLSCTP